MAASAKCHIYIATTWVQLQSIHTLMEQYGDVVCRAIWHNINDLRHSRNRAYLFNVQR